MWAPVPQDMEKLAAKQGVVLQTVKDVVEALVNDELVRVDRIGQSKYYWCAVRRPQAPGFRV